MLCKDEDKRASADEIMVHAWLQKGSSVTDGPQGNNDDEENQQQDDFRVDVANDGIAERRRVLMERLSREQKKKESKLGGTAKSKRQDDANHYWAKWFTIVDKHSPGSTLKFEWWADDKVNASDVLKLEGVQQTAARMNGEKSPEFVRYMLREHGIDDTLFGQGEAKTLEHMASEVQSGAARLMLDATEHKKLVRVVDVVLLRLYNTKEHGKLLVETGEQFPDGRRRNIARLPGTKKEPHENSKETAQRILQDTLQIRIARMLAVQVSCMRQGPHRKDAARPVPQLNACLDQIAESYEENRLQPRRPP